MSASSKPKGPTDFKVNNPMMAPKVKVPTVKPSNTNREKEQRNRNRTRRAASAFKRLQTLQEVATKKRPDKFAELLGSLDKDFEQQTILKEVNSLFNLLISFRSSTEFENKTDDINTLQTKASNLFDNIEKKLRALEDIIDDLPDSPNEQKKETEFNERKKKFLNLKKEFEGYLYAVLCQTALKKLKYSTEILDKVKSDLQKLRYDNKVEHDDILFESDAKKIVGPYEEKGEAAIQTAEDAIRTLDQQIPLLKEYTKNFVIRFGTNNSLTSEELLKQSQQSMMKQISDVSFKTYSDSYQMSKYYFMNQLEREFKNLINYDKYDHLLLIESDLQNTGSLIFHNEEMFETKLREKEKKKIAIQKRIILKLREILNKRIDTPFENLEETINTLAAELKKVNESSKIQIQDLIERISKASTLSEKDILAQERQKILDEDEKRKTRFFTLCELSKNLQLLNTSIPILKKRVENKEGTEKEKKQEFKRIYTDVFDKGFEYKSYDETEPIILYPKMGETQEKTPFVRLLKRLQAKMKDDTDESKAYAELYAKLFVYMYLLVRDQVRRGKKIDYFSDMFHEVGNEPDFRVVFSDENIKTLSSMIPKLKDLDFLIEEAYFKLKPKTPGNPEYKERLFDTNEFIKRLPRLREIL